MTTSWSRQARIISSFSPFRIASVALCSTCVAGANRYLKKSTSVGFSGIGSSFLSSLVVVCSSSFSIIWCSSASASVSDGMTLIAAAVPRVARKARRSICISASSCGCGGAYRRSSQDSTGIPYFTHSYFCAPTPNHPQRLALFQFIRPRRQPDRNVQQPRGQHPNTGFQLRGSAPCRRNLLQGLNGDLFVAAFDANYHLILVADGHFQLHRVVLLQNGAGGANTSIQQTLEPLIAIGRKVQNALIGRNREWHAPGEASRSAVSVRGAASCRSMHHEACSIHDFPCYRDGIRLGSSTGSSEARRFGQQRAVETIYRIEHSGLRREAIPNKSCHGLLLRIFLMFAEVWTRSRRHLAHIRQAAVVLKGICAQSWIRKVLNIYTH